MEHGKNRTTNGTSTKTGKNSSEELEMITGYTSLRDMISTTSSSSAAGVSTPPMPGSPPSMKNSWDDIPIKNPLVKQAALSYLQPMSTPPEIDGDRSWVKDGLRRCCCFAGDDDVEVGCLGLLDGVVWSKIKEALGKILGRDHQD